MLGLISSTDPRWVDVALGDLDAVLVDHLHCELKAASNATALVARYPMHPRLVRELTALAQEELTHVQQVFDRLEARGVRATPPEEDVYARTLRRALGDGRGDPLLDRLAVAALIEARSCERFQLLAAHAPTAALRDWYDDLFTSEARHHVLFAAIAEEVFGEARARARIRMLSEREAEILAQQPIRPRVH
jgi:tRNA-(ms[2]io[6]A)-hydroxylase